MDELGQTVANSLDDMMMAIQRFFCRHKQTIPVKYDEWSAVCVKCGKCR